MAMINSHASSLSPISNPLKELMLDRWVIFLVLLSMMIQIVLVSGGAIRHCSGSRWLNFIVWVCYMGADFVATSALGSMIHYSSGARVYAIWACVVIVHLGGPDTITAYSVPDSNLWRRHCFNMSYQGSIAAYVVYASAVQGRAQIERYLMAACFLIFIVGITKYAERALALWLASPSQIVSSVQPIHNYMKIEHALGLQIDDRILDNDIADVDIFREQHQDKVDDDSLDYQYIVSGEHSFNEDDVKGEWSETIVTIKDVWEHEGQVVTNNYVLCVSHALFKMYKRRFASLRFHEADLWKTRLFFAQWPFSRIQVCNIVEMELKFMYDYLFSKSSGTAFSAWGVGMRAVNICVLGLCWYFIVRGLQETEDVLPGQRIVTYIVMSVAVGVEVFQLGRIVVSDWSMVWLICANIRQSRKVSERWWWGRCSMKVMGGVAKVVGRVRKAVGGKYWQNQIPQLCIIESCFSAAGSYSYPFLKRVIGFLPFSEFIQGCYIRAVWACHIKREFVDDHTKHRVLNYVTPRRGSIGEELSRAKWMLLDEEEGVGWEHVILAWHVATTIKERLQDQSEIEDDEEEKRAFSFVVGMSRYFAYLLVTWPEVLPVDAEYAKELYKEVWVEMMGEIEKENGSVDDFCRHLMRDSSDRSWSRGPSIVLRMAKRGVDSSWDNWAINWMRMLYTCGMHDKSGEHGERVTVGGEWMSMVWVLMGHTGMAEESYNPTAMKRDPRQWEGNPTALKRDPRQWEW